MTRNFLTLLGLAWGLSIALAYYLGRSATSDPDNGSTAPQALASDATNSPPERPATDASTGETGAKAALAAAGLDLPATDSDTLLDKIQTNIANLTANPRLADELREQLLELAKTSPLQALQLSGQITSPRVREQATNNILRQWASTDPMAAFQWIDANSSNLTRSVHDAQLAAAYRGFAENNPQAAFTQASQLGEANAYERRLKNRIMGDLIRTRVENGELVAAKQSIEQMADSELRDSLLGDLVGVWAETEPAEAAAYIASLGEAATSQQKAALARSWARTDPAAAAAWLDSLDPADPAVGRAARDLVREWARYDLNASAEWLNSRPASPEMDRAIASYTYHAVQEDPASAMEWAGSVNNERMSGYLRMRVAGAWREDDPAAFQSYLDNSDFSDEEKERLQKANSWGTGRGPRGR